MGKKTRDSLLILSKLRILLAIQMEVLNRKLRLCVWSQRRAPSWELGNCQCIAGV